MTLYERVGNLVDAHRKRLGLTQQTLADRCGLSAEMISRIENGHSGLRFSRIIDLSAALEVDPSELFSLDLAAQRNLRPNLVNLTAKLAKLSDAELVWAERLLEAALKPKA